MDTFQYVDLLRYSSGLIDGSVSQPQNSWLLITVGRLKNGCLFKK